MGNRAGAFCGSSVCPKAGQGGDNEILDDTNTCDPAGAVFQETLEDLNEVDRLLLTFSSSANLAVVRWLFVFGANADACDTNGTTCLHAACRSGSLAIVKEFIRRDLPLNATDVAGWTALHVALFMGRRAVALRLMQSGAELSARNLKGLVPVDLCSDVWLREAVAACAAHRRICGPDAPWHFTREGEMCEDVQLCSRLRFEPFFVPRAPVLKEGPSCSWMLDVGVEIFNQRPGQGLAFLVAVGAVRDFPVELSCFMLENRVSHAQVGEFLGENFSLSQTLRLEYVNAVRLAGTGVVSCLSEVFQQFQMPSDLHKVDRLMDGVAQIWWRQHEQLKESSEPLAEPEGEEVLAEVHGLSLMGHLAGHDVLHQLMLSTVLLHWNLHAPLPQSQRLTVEQWLDLNTGLVETGTADSLLGFDVTMMRHIMGLIYNLVSRSFFPQLQIWSGRALSPGPVREATTSSLGKEGTAEAAASSECTMEGWALLVGGSFPTLAGSSGTVTYRHIRSILSETTSSTLALASPVTSRSSRAGPGGAGSTGACIEVQTPEHNAACAGVAPTVTYRHPVLSTVPEAVLEGKPVPAASGHDKVWLSLRRDLLFLASKPSGWAPYAFVHLEDVVVQSVDEAALTLTVAMRSPRPVEPSGGMAQILEPPQMQLVFLLPDGRWQVLESPYMQIQVPDLEQLERWMAGVEEAQELHGGGEGGHAVVDREATATI